MFKRKPIYIILLIVFTLLLAADVVAYCLTADISSGMPGISGGTHTPGNFGGGQWNGSGIMPQTSDGSEASGADGSGSAPQRGDGSETTDADSSGSAPQVSGEIGMPEDFDPSQMQGGFGGQVERGGPGNMGSMLALVQFITGWWIPIGILCLLADGLSIFMLIRISKKRSAAGGAVEETAAAEEPKAKRPAISGYDKRRRKRYRTIRLVLILGFVVVTILGYTIASSIYTAQLEKENAASVISTEAVGTQMDTGISGTGTLVNADVIEITVPNGVKLASFGVKDGDTVAAGDVLATVDHTSVMKAIEDLQDATDLLDEEIDAASSDTIESSIVASVDGRVKVIFAQEDTGVADTMYDNGALMLLSLDGLMAVDIETNADVAIGDSVLVTLSTGETQDGRVAGYAEGVATITLTDDGTVYGDEATISDESGNTLGTGTLYIHSALKMTGYSGTVANIKCSENEEVSAGKILMTLTNTEYTAEYDLLLDKRNNYEDEMMKLFKLYQDGNIYAEYAGTISGVDEESTTGYTGVRTSQTANSSASQMVCAQSTPIVESLVYQTGEISASVLLGNNPTGADDAAVAGYANFAATVSGVSYGAIAVKQCAASVSVTDYSDFASLGITSDMMSAEAALSPSMSTPVYMYLNGAWTPCSVGDIATGDVLILTYGTSDGSAGGDPVWIVIASKGQNQESGGNGGNNGGSSYSGGSGNSSSSSATTEDTTTPEDLYSISDTTVMSETPGSAMSVRLTIDELDILKMKVGQNATITLDALSGQTFTGSVTSIDTAGTNSGGSTKFTAVVTLDKTEQMLAGMNAAVSITLSSAQCAVTVPVAALEETQAGVVVYTSYDEENNTLGSPVCVTTGLSDGTNVEILSGLSADEKVWYGYDDTVDISSSTVSSGGGGFNLMSIFGGGRGGRG